MEWLTCFITQINHDLASVSNFVFFFKVWSVPRSNVTLVTREEPLQPKRVPSVFADNKENRVQPMETEVEGQIHEDVKKVSMV